MHGSRRCVAQDQLFQERLLTIERERVDRTLGGHDQLFPSFAMPALVLTHVEDRELQPEDVDHAKPAVQPSRREALASVLRQARYDQLQVAAECVCALETSECPGGAFFSDLGLALLEARGDGVQLDAIDLFRVVLLD